MSLDFATLTSVKKVQNLQHENLPIQDINFPTKNSKSPDFGSRMYHMYEISGERLQDHWSSGFLFLLQNIDCGYSLEPPHTINVLSKNKKNIKKIHLKINIFTAVKYCCILHGPVFVMVQSCKYKTYLSYNV